MTAKASTPSLESIFPPNVGRSGTAWLGPWVQDQLDRTPPNLFSCLVGVQEGQRTNLTDIIGVWNTVAARLQQESSVSINTLVAELRTTNLLRTDYENEEEGWNQGQNLVFAVFGWQTMLYTPDYGSVQPSQLAIQDELDGFQGLARMALKQDLKECKKPLHRFLLGFGVMLPPVNFSIADDPNDKKAFQQLKTVQADYVNAHLLVSLGHTKLVWVDSLACHLELDQAGNTLYLFKYPSFCVESKRRPDSTGVVQRSALHSCAAPADDCKQWATVDEIDQTLHEILLSYRLLFGRSKRSRQLFRRIDPFSGANYEKDLLLSVVCGKKSYDELDSVAGANGEYDLIRDFPILRSRLVALEGFISSRKPRAWKQLWDDKRDSAQWFTFWAVIFVGGAGLFLGFVQVVLSAIQVGLQIKSL